MITFLKFDVKCFFWSRQEIFFILFHISLGKTNSMMGFPKVFYSNKSLVVSGGNDMGAMLFSTCLGKFKSFKENKTKRPSQHFYCFLSVHGQGHWQLSDVCSLSLSRVKSHSLKQKKNIYKWTSGLIADRSAHSSVISLILRNSSSYSQSTLSTPTLPRFHLYHSSL